MPPACQAERQPRPCLKRELTWPWLQQQPHVSAGAHHILPSKLPTAAHAVAVAPSKQATGRDLILLLSLFVKQDRFANVMCGARAYGECAQLTLTRCGAMTHALTSCFSACAANHSAGVTPSKNSLYLHSTQHRQGMPAPVPCCLQACWPLQELGCTANHEQCWLPNSHSQLDKAQALLLAEVWLRSLMAFTADPEDYRHALHDAAGVDADGGWFSCDEPHLPAYLLHSSSRSCCLLSSDFTAAMAPFRRLISRTCVDQA